MVLKIDEIPLLKMDISAATHLFESRNWRRKFE